MKTYYLTFKISGEVVSYAFETEEKRDSVFNELYNCYSYTKQDLIYIEDRYYCTKYISWFKKGK